MLAMLVFTCHAPDKSDSSVPDVHGEIVALVCLAGFVWAHVPNCTVGFAKQNTHGAVIEERRRTAHDHRLEKVRTMILEVYASAILIDKGSLSGKGRDRDDSGPLSAHKQPLNLLARHLGQFDGGSAPPELLNVGLAILGRVRRPPGPVTIAVDSRVDYVWSVGVNKLAELGKDDSIGKQQRRVVHVERAFVALSC